jgi:salicylate hydroxylase
LSFFSFFLVYGAPYYLCHRADIHAGLLEAALKAGADIRTNAAVVKYDFETPSVTLANGTVIKGDLVIAADGIKSLARASVLGKAEDAVDTGDVAYRIVRSPSRLSIVLFSS